MPHVGRPYPWVQNYDTWVFSRGEFAALAAKYQGMLRIRIGGTLVSCTDVGNIESADWTVDYTLGHVSWIWTFPCTPARTCELRLVIKTDLITSKWQWLHYLAGVEQNRSIQITRANPYGMPNTASTLQWENNPNVWGLVESNSAVLRVPWPT
jgi:hypothetical protein